MLDKKEDHFDTAFGNIAIPNDFSNAAESKEWNFVNVDHLRRCYCLNVLCDM